MTSVLLVIGPPRSGTTWLVRELSQAPNAFPMIPECSAITSHIKLFCETKYLTKDRFDAFYGTQENCLAHFKKIISDSIELVSLINRKNNFEELLILKDPYLSLYLVEVEKLLPEAKKIIILRDPRDVIASMKDVSRRKLNHKFLLEPVLEVFFNYYYRIINDKNKLTSMQTVKYEELVATGADALRTSVGLKQPEPTARDFRYDQLQFDQKDPFFSELYVAPTTTSKIGCYRKILDSHEISQVTSVFSGIMHALGYSTESAG